MVSSRSVQFIRRYLLAFASVWLLSEISLLAAVPVLLASGHAGESGELLCTCSTLGPGHFCPMHGMMSHHSDSASDQEHGSTECVLNPPAPVSTAPLSSLLSGLGPLPMEPKLSLGRPAAEPVETIALLTIYRPTRPELPPPRSES